MTAAKLDEFIRREPFQPFKLTVWEGEEIIVHRPRKSMVSGDEIALVGICRRNGGVGVEKFRLLGVDQVKSAEILPAGSRFPFGKGQ